MSTIDKVIKQCFKDTSNAFMMIIFGGLSTSMLIAFGFTMVVAPVTLIVMVVGVYKVFAYLFYKSVCSEEALMYQMLPVSAEEAIVSRIFVGMVAWVLFYLTFVESLAFGITLLSSDLGVMEAIDEFCQLVYTIGAGATIAFLVLFLSSIYLEVVLIFAGVTYFNTGALVKQKKMLRVMVILVVWALIKLSELLYSQTLNFAAQGNMGMYYFATVGFVLISILAGCIFCKQIKKRLEHHLQL